MPKDVYKEAGVDTSKSDSLVNWLIQENDSNKKQTLGSPVSSIGGFAGLFKTNFSLFEEPLLVAATDGVGTKLLLALQNDKIDYLGQDLVAMCVNDLYTIGAKPLFFLDYYATGMLDEVQFKKVLDTIKVSLDQCQTYLLGGETAELPGLYANKHFDLAGFVVGVVDNKKKLGPSLVKKDDILLGFKSNGFHSNGFSLIRKWLKESSVDANPSLIDKILTPTKIYHRVPDMIDTFPGAVHSIAHITGGGISGNLTRVIPKTLGAIIKKESIQTPRWMSHFVYQHSTDFSSLEKVFNLGIGLVACVDKDLAKDIETYCNEVDLDCYQIGQVTSETTEIIFK